MEKNAAHGPTLRVINILELLSGFPGGLSLSEIAHKTNASKSTILPVLRTLAERRFIVLSDKTRRYTIGLAAYCAGAVFDVEKTALRFIKKEMAWVVEKSGEICQVGVLDNGEALYVAKADSKEPIQIASFIGKRLPAYSTALGKALLSAKPVAEVRALYPNGLTAHTAHTITDFDVLEKELLCVRQTGLAHEKGEMTDQIECFAVPLFAQNTPFVKTPFAAMSICAPFFRVTEDKRTLFYSLLKEAKSRIETYLYTHPFEVDSLLWTNLA